MKFTEKRRLIFYVLSGGIVIFLFLFFCGISVFILFFLSKKRKTKSNYNNFYQVSNLNPSSNKTSFGFVRVSKELNEDEYISYFNPETGSTSIISNIFDTDTEYKCTGSCYCEEENNRRNAFSVINKGMLIILSALTVTMAINIAKDTFQNECESKLSGLCAKKFTKSDVIGCDPEVSRREQRDDIETFKDEDLHIRRYKCLGHCVDNFRHLHNHNVKLNKVRTGLSLKEAREEFGECEDLKMSEEVFITVPCTKKWIDTSNTLAKTKFITKYLTEFCRTNSFVKAEVLRNYSQFAGKKKAYFESVESTACVARAFSMRNVKCRIFAKEYFDVGKVDEK